MRRWNVHGGEGSGGRRANDNRLKVETNRPESGERVSVGPRGEQVTSCHGDNCTPQQHVIHPVYIFIYLRVWKCLVCLERLEKNNLNTRRRLLVDAGTCGERMCISFQLLSDSQCNSEVLIFSPPTAGPLEGFTNLWRGTKNSKLQFDKYANRKKSFTNSTLSN